MITILTPTFNRAHILPVLFESLKKQTIMDFEWIVVDDGSEDNTREIVESWIDKKNAFEITYIKQKNGGKHRALNKGIPFAKYEFIYIIDSDDYMTSNAVEMICKWIKSVDIEKYAGVSGLRGKKTNKGIEVLGYFPQTKDWIDATNLERRTNNLLGDKAEVYRKDLLLKFPFPEFAEEKFLGESAVWDKIAGEGFKIRWFNEIICICEYLEGGLTKTDSEDRKLNNFMGYSYVEKMNVELLPMHYSLVAIGRFSRLARKKGLSRFQIRKELEVNLLKLVLGEICNYLWHLVNKLKN